MVTPIGSRWQIINALFTELLIVSKSGHHLDLYSIQTGKVDKVIEQEGDSPHVLLTPLVSYNSLSPF